MNFYFLVSSYEQAVPSPLVVKYPMCSNVCMQCMFQVFFFFHDCVKNNLNPYCFVFFKAFSAVTSSRPDVLATKRFTIRIMMSRELCKIREGEAKK